MTIDRALIILAREYHTPLNPVSMVLAWRDKTERQYAAPIDQIERDIQEAIKTVGAYLLGVTP